MCIGHKGFPNDHIVWQPFEDLKCLDELLWFDPSCVCQSHGADGLRDFAVACSKGWWALGTFVRCEVKTCMKSVSLHEQRLIDCGS